MSSGQETWEQIGTELMANDPAISWSTMMGLPCLRVDGAFFASLDHRTGDLVVKLPADEVSARIERGAGKPFAPAGKVFREWLAIEPGGVAVWRAAVADALSFVRSS